MAGEVKEEEEEVKEGRMKEGGTGGRSGLREMVKEEGRM